MKLSPRVDFAFKLIFEQHKDMLMSLINAIVSEKDQVQQYFSYCEYGQWQKVHEVVTR